MCIRDRFPHPVASVLAYLEAPSSFFWERYKRQDKLVICVLRVKTLFGAKVVVGASSRKNKSFMIQFEAGNFLDCGAAKKVIDI